MVAALLVYALAALFAPLVACALPVDVVLQPSSTPPSLNITSSQIEALNDTKSYRCSSKSEWNSPGFTVQDCEAALDWLYYEELAEDGGRDRREFLTQYAKSSEQKKKLELTPRKYTFGTCTIGIVMISTFKAGELPGEHRRGRFNTDVSTWRKVWQTAAFVLEHCVKSHQEAGWEPVGKKHFYSRFTCIGSA